MNTDIRLHIEFWQHAKTIRMIQDLGLQGPVSLLILWCYAAKHRADGILRDMDARDIELAATWPQDRSGEFFKYMTENRWLDKTARRGTWAIHEWKEYNSWAADAPARTARAKKGAHAKNHVGEKRDPVNCQFCFEEDQAVLNSASSTLEHPLSKLAPAPNPSPAPIAKNPPISPLKGGRGQRRRRTEGIAIFSEQAQFDAWFPKAQRWIEQNGEPISDRDRERLFNETGGLANSGVDWNQFSRWRSSLSRQQGAAS